MKKILLVLCLLPSLLACSTNELNCTLDVEKVEDNYEFHTEKQLEYLLSDSLDKMPDGVAGTIDQSKPKPLTFKFKAKGSGVSKDVQYVLKLSENKDLKDALIYSTSDESIDVTNLKIETKYYYQVSAYSNSKFKNSPIYSFETNDTFLRNIDISGVANCRDIGGFVNSDGDRSEQGLIYRTGRLNVSASRSEIYPKPNKEVYLDITDDGIYTMLNELNVQTEIDVRTVKDDEVGFITESPLGDSVTYYNLPMEWENLGSSNILDYNKEKVQQFFQILGDENNYPLFFHCDIGTDRTGMFSILLHGLLGDDPNDIHKDYLFSNYGMIKESRTYSKTDPYRKKLESAEGDTFAQKTRNYLIRNIGVNENDIDTFVYIMTNGIKPFKNKETYLKVFNKEKTLKVGDSLKLSYLLESNRNIDDYKIDFSSSDSSILKVDEKGNVSALKAGIAKIILKNVSSNSKKELMFEVLNPEDIKEYKYHFEGEEATLGGTSSNKPSVKTKYEGDETYGTDGILVSIVDSVSNQYLEYVVVSTKEQDVSIVLRVAVYSRAKAFYNKCVKSIIVNEETYTLDDTDIEVEDELKYGTMPWYNWGYIYIDDVNLIEGENTIRINIANSPKTNFDYMAIDAEYEVY